MLYNIIKKQKIALYRLQTKHELVCYFNIVTTSVYTSSLVSVKALDIERYKLELPSNLVVT